MMPAPNQPIPVVFQDIPLSPSHGSISPPVRVPSQTYISASNPGVRLLSVGVRSVNRPKSPPRIQVALR